VSTDAASQRLAEEDDESIDVCPFSRVVNIDGLKYHATGCHIKADGIHGGQTVLS